MKIETKTVTFGLGHAGIIADILEQYIRRVERECQEFGIDRNNSICPEIDPILKKIEEAFRG